MTGRPTARVGVIVNPIAGMGGRVGLKGTDGDGTLERARALGALPVAPARALDVAQAIEVGAARLSLMLDVTVVEPRSAAGTREAASAFRDSGVALLLFVGGDGTACDVCTAVGASLPVLGVPAGVKMHSGVFATGTRSAAEVVVAWFASAARRTREAEVVDIDEDAVREGRMSVRLYGTLRVPDVPGRIQSLKASGGVTAAAELAGLAAEVVARLAPDSLLVLGPGTTTRAVGLALDVETTLLGVDVVAVAEAGDRAAGSVVGVAAAGPVVGQPVVGHGVVGHGVVGPAVVGRAVVGRVIAFDAGESQILAAIAGASAVAAISPTGGQGFLLGRGNQQLSPAVLRAIGPANVLVVATLSKLATLQGRPLYVDTGDPALDAEFAGHRRVITGRGQETVVRIEAG